MSNLKLHTIAVFSFRAGENTMFADFISIMCLYFFCKFCVSCFMTRCAFNDLSAAEKTNRPQNCNILSTVCHDRHRV